MPMERKKLEGDTLEQLTDLMQEGPIEGSWYCAASAELERRKFEQQMEVNKAQIEAAQAAKDTAEYTRRNALFMLCSVIAVLVTSGASAFFQYLTWATR